MFIMKWMEKILKQNSLNEILSLWVLSIRGLSIRTSHTSAWNKGDLKGEFFIFKVVHLLKSNITLPLGLKISCFCADNYLHDTLYVILRLVSLTEMTEGFHYTTSGYCGHRSLDDYASLVASSARITFQSPQSGFHSLLLSFCADELVLRWLMMIWIK